MPVTPEDLARLGLSDPNTGQPFTPPDQTGAQQPVQSPAWLEGLEYASEERAREAEARASGQAQPQTNPWDSDQNPYKREAEQLRQQAAPQQSPAELLAAYKTQLRQQAAAAWDEHVRNKVPQEVATAIVTAQLQAAESQAELAIHRQAALPMVRNGIAAEVAQEYSKDGAVIKPEELQGEQTLDAMRARAKTLKETRSTASRDAAYQARMAAGVDKAEGQPAPTGQPRVPDKLRPEQRIAYGLARGHL